MESESQSHICRNCGSPEYFTADSHFGGHSRSVLPLGFWSSAQARFRICGRCGLVDWFLTKDSLEIVREGFEKGGNFVAGAPPEPEPPPLPRSGRFAIEDDSLVYKIDGMNGWQVPISDLRVIGEYTDEGGPGADDYFFTFLTATDFFEASFYAEDRDAMLAQLSARLGHPLRPGLCDSTSLASRVLWPARLEGEPVFDFVPEVPAGSLLDRLGQRMMPSSERRLTEKLMAELEG